MFIEDYTFNTFIIIFCLMLFIMLIAIIPIMTKNLKQRAKDSQAPLLKVAAQVIGKRLEVSGNHSFTTYYLTFAVESGDRIELRVEGEEYGQLVEQDVGLLSFKGTRLVSFERKNSLDV